MLILLACIGAAALLAPVAGAKQSVSWAQPQIRTVVAYGLMAKSVASFKPNAVLTQAQLEELLPALPTETIDDPSSTDPITTDPTTTTTATTITDPSHNPATTSTTTTNPTSTTPASPQANAPVTVSAFDAALVDRLGLTAAAARFQSAARQAGLAPPKRFGTEIVARLLGLRTNHPASQDQLELLPSDSITRAETAFSVARVLSFSGGETQWVEDESFSFTLPQLNRWQKRILNYAISLIGYPYIWGGTSPTTQTVFGRVVKGGFDCSGLVWRVYKLRRYSGEGRLSSTLRGRTTFVMSGEVPRSKRIPYAALQPGDVLFFGSNGPRSLPAQVFHTAIYLGYGWYIQSSGNGVDIVPLESWSLTHFAWARRPLAEAGLVNVYAVQPS